MAYNKNYAPKNLSLICSAFNIFVSKIFLRQYLIDFVHENKFCFEFELVSTTESISKKNITTAKPINP